MSERSVNENNKLWEAAERVAEKVVAAKKAESEEERRKQKKRIVKLVLLMTLIALIIVFASIAWFSMNRDVGTSGMGISVAGVNYEITMLSGGNNGKYYDDYHSLVKDSSALIWQMTDDSNMDNYEDSGTSSSSGSEEEDTEGIHPGSFGVVSFYVTPKINTVYLDFQFEILGYTAAENETTHEITMTQLNSTLGPAKYLNGHILLFENRSGTAGNYTYSNPILSNEDMKRVISGKRYDGNGTRTRVDIYWVWPNTLSKIVDARSCTKMTITEVPFTDTSSADYTKIITNVETYPQYYLKIVETNEEESEIGSGTESSSITVSDIATDYDVYGDYYDQADNDIGMGVNFVLLKMSVSEVSSNGSGSGE